MKPILGILLITFVFMLSGCDKIDITPDVIEVYVEDMTWDDGTLLMDLYITNGTTSDFPVDQLELWFDLPNEQSNEDGSTTFAGAIFLVEDTVPSNGFLQFAISFTPSYIYMDKEILTELEISLSDLILQYEFI